METFLDSIISITLVISVIMNFVVLFHIHMLDDIQKKILENGYEEKLLSAIDRSDDRIIELVDKITDLSVKIDRSMVALESTLEPTIPMKSNNWDSIREAFKRPPRVDLNDRD